jgi:hypothetical protein
MFPYLVFPNRFVWLYYSLTVIYRKMMPLILKRGPEFRYDGFFGWMDTKCMAILYDCIRLPTY